MGAFTYSPQEGTRAAQYVDDVHETVKRERLERLTELQRSITAERYESRVGRTALALVDRSDLENGTSQARLPWQADDIDGVTQIDVALAPGTFAEVAVEEVVDDYDFQASVIRVALPADVPERRRVSQAAPNQSGDDRKLRPLMRFLPHQPPPAPLNGLGGRDGAGSRSLSRWSELAGQSVSRSRRRARRRRTR